MDWRLIQRGLGRIEIFLVTSHYRNQVNRSWWVTWLHLKELQIGSRPGRAILIWLVVTGTWLDCFHRNIGNFIIPSDFHIFQRGRSTTNQLWRVVFLQCWKNASRMLLSPSPDLTPQVLRDFGRDWALSRETSHPAAICSNDWAALADCLDTYMNSGWRPPAVSQSYGFKTGNTASLHDPCAIWWCLPMQSCVRGISP